MFRSPDNGACGLPMEGLPHSREEFGGKDMFGVEWEYVDVAEGYDIHKDIVKIIKKEIF